MATKKNPFDLIQSLKVKRMLGGMFEPQGMIGIPQEPTPAPVIPSPLNPPDVGLSALRARKTPAMDEYKAYLGSEPSRKDYNPGKVNKILSAIAGFAEGTQRGPISGVKTAQGLMDRPYQEARQDWESKGGRLKELAGLEYQGMTDEQKLEVQIAADERARTKEMHDWIKDQKGMDLSDAQIANLKDQARSRGKTFQKSDDGHWYVVDMATNETMDLGKFAQSTTEKKADEKELFQFKFGIEQGGRVSLENMREAHDKNMEGIRKADAQELERLRHSLGRTDKALEKKLEGMSPSAQKSAWELAYQQTATDMPDAKPDSDEFRNGIRQRLGEVRERAEDPTKPAFTTPTVSAPPNDVPSVSLNGNDESTKIALAELAKINITNPTQEMIDEAKKDLGLK